MISRHAYRKSTFSAGGECIEVRLLEDGTVGLRDSKDVSKPPHVFTQREWRAFVAGVRAGEFDLHHDQSSANGGKMAASLILKLQVRLPGWAWSAIGGVGGTAAIQYLIFR